MSNLGDLIRAKIAEQQRDRDSADTEVLAAMLLLPTPAGVSHRRMLCYMRNIALATNYAQYLAAWRDGTTSFHNTVPPLGCIDYLVFLPTGQVTDSVGNDYTSIVVGHPYRR